MIHSFDNAPFTLALACYSQFPAMMGSSPGPPRGKACLSEGALKIVIGAGRSVHTLSYAEEWFPTDFNSFWLPVQLRSHPFLGSDLRVIFSKAFSGGFTSHERLLFASTRNKQPSVQTKSCSVRRCLSPPEIFTAAVQGTIGAGGWASHGQSPLARQG